MRLKSMTWQKIWSCSADVDVDTKPDTDDDNNADDNNTDVNNTNDNNDDDTDADEEDDTDDDTDDDINNNDTDCDADAASSRSTKKISVAWFSSFFVRRRNVPSLTFWNANVLCLETSLNKAERNFGSFQKKGKKMFSCSVKCIHGKTFCEENYLAGIECEGSIGSTTITVA